MKHILIINRYDDEFSNYRKYIDHTQVDVSYISLIGYSGKIEPAESNEVIELSELDVDSILKAACEIHIKYPLDTVIAFSEYDLDAAAQVRTKLNISGANVDDNMLCRNKASMKAALVGSTVRYPQYRHVSTRYDVEQFCNEYGYPAILKPQVGAASAGVVKIESFSDIPNITDFIGYEIEEYIQGDIYHIDAILNGNDMPYFKVSKYINTCLNFRDGLPLGSVTVDNTNFIAKARTLTESICTRLNLKNQAIHLEVIECNDELVFLEIGGRVGGGEIPFITLFNEGIDLYELWTKSSLGMAIAEVKTRITGFLMMPNPFIDGFAFNSNMELTHPLLTYQNIKPCGRNNGFSYEEIPARLHFMGDSQNEVENAIKQCMDILQNSISPKKYF